MGTSTRSTSKPAVASATTSSRAPLRSGSVRVVPSHGRGRLAEQVLELAPGDPVGVDALEGDAGQSARLGLGDGAPVGLVEEVRLQREVHGAAGHVEGQLLWLEVVLEEGHREGQGDPAAETVARGRQPAVHGRAGQRSPAAVEPGHPEQAQDGPLLADRRRRPRARRSTRRPASRRARPVGRGRRTGVAGSVTLAG